MEPNRYTEFVYPFENRIIDATIDRLSVDIGVQLNTCHIVVDKTTVEFGKRGVTTVR